jgi:Uma2 family endonuclease
MSAQPTLTNLITAEEYFKLPETMQPTQLIDGVIVVSPTPKMPHQDTALEIATLLKKLKPHGRVTIAPMDVHLDQWNVLQPDVMWIAKGSSATVGDWVTGAPDLVVEVLSPSTERVDRSRKFNLYQQFGVREYWIVRVEPQTVEVYRHDGNQFQHIGAYGVDDTFVSQVLGHQTIPVREMFLMDEA